LKVFGIKSLNLIYAQTKTRKKQKLIDFQNVKKFRYCGSKRIYLISQNKQHFKWIIRQTKYYKAFPPKH